MASKHLHRTGAYEQVGPNPKIQSPTSHTHSRNQKVRHTKVKAPRQKGLMNSKGIRGELY